MLFCLWAKRIGDFKVIIITMKDKCLRVMSKESMWLEVLTITKVSKTVISTCVRVSHLLSNQTTMPMNGCWLNIAIYRDRYTIHLLYIVSHAFIDFIYGEVGWVNPYWKNIQFDEISNNNWMTTKRLRIWRQSSRWQSHGHNLWWFTEEKKEWKAN